MGEVRKRGGIYWLRYYRNGKRFEESARTNDKKAATDLLRVREGDIAKGMPVSSRIGRYRFDDAVTDITSEYTVNNRRSLPDLERRIRLHLKPWFGTDRMNEITTSEALAFTRARLAAGASPGEVNRELTVLKRMFSLAVQAGRLLHRPHIPMLKEDNIRSGFFEAEQFRAVLQHLKPPQRAAAKFAYLTGWRLKSEVLPLEWRQVDFDAGEVRLDPGTTKNGEGRIFPMTIQIRSLLKEREGEAERLRRRKGKIVRYVFHRLNGNPIRGFRKAWTAACKAAGCPGRVPHDLRRSAVREFVRAGIPERVAMQLTGHKTRSVFERYNIVSSGDLRAAAAKLDATGTISGTMADAAKSSGK